MKRWLVLLATGVVLTGVILFFLVKGGVLKVVREGYPCPLSRKYCRSAQEVFLNGKYYGLGFKVVSEEEYLAVMDSTGADSGVSMLSATQGVLQKYRFFRLKGEEYSMVYVFNGEPLDLQGIIVSGDVLGKVPGEKVDELGDYNLVVFWEDKEGNRIEVLPKELK